MDRIDLKILALLHQEGRISNVDLAERVALSPTPCLRRVKRLEEAGVIAFYRAELDKKKLGLGVTAFVCINIGDHGPKATENFLSSVEMIDEIVACHVLSGQFDFLLEVVTETLDQYASVMLNRLGGLPGVSALQTSFALRTTKSRRKLPLGHLGVG
ncbi:MAG: Lrp/AsnC family transcriptional regulator [Comamonadaceae bacterium]|nr:MAG: Lrp/AsnC family transcriptional regulator [Comamonadaceae bacterium]